MRSVRAAADGVADRGAYADDVVIRKVGVVIYDVVVANLRADKDVVPHVVANAGTHVDQEVVAALEAGAEIDTTGGRRVAVEAGALKADAPQKIESDSFAQLGLVHAVEVEDDGAEGLTAGLAVSTLGRSPGGFKIEAHALMEDDVEVEIGI